ncbi:MAG: hypothetical protein AB1896_09955, partial [Thermodesulfobacteriota bacterium]
MNDLILKFRKVIDISEKTPYLLNSGDIAKQRDQVDKKLDIFLDKLNELLIEQQPGYPEVAALIEGDGKAIATVDFMNKYSKQLDSKFKASKAD